MLDERVHNYPEGYCMGPFCPQTKLIQISASLVGIELTAEDFCTQIMSDPNYGGPYHGLESATLRPAASCSKVNQDLLKQLELVKEKISLTPDEVINQELNEVEDFDAKKAVIDKYTSERERYSKQQEILIRWRKVIFETSVGTTEDEKNPHFRQFKSADELSIDEIMHKVEQYKAALLKIVGHEENTGWLHGVVSNCPQAPKHDTYIAPPYL
jgi:hypothetical protein